MSDKPTYSPTNDPPQSRLTKTNPMIRATEENSRFISSTQKWTKPKSKFSSTSSRKKVRKIILPNRKISTSLGKFNS